MSVIAILLFLDWENFMNYPAILLENEKPYLSVYYQFYDRKPP